MKTSQLAGGFSTPIVSAAEDRAGLVRFATQAEVLQGIQDGVAVQPSPEIIMQPFRNLAINGNFVDWPKAAADLTNLSNKTGHFYTAGDWIVSSKGAFNYDITEEAGGLEGSEDYGQHMKLSINTGDPTLASDDWLVIQKLIEGYGIRRLYNTNFSLSFYVKTNKSGTCSIALRGNAGTTLHYVKRFTIDQANTWQLVKIENIPRLKEYADYFNWGVSRGLDIAWCLACGSALDAANEATWEEGNDTVMPGQTNFASSPGDNFSISAFQLEANPYCTPFEERHHAIDLEMRKRYYQQINKSLYLSGIVTTSDTIWFDGIEFPVEMRGIPAYEVTKAQIYVPSWQNCTSYNVYPYTTGFYGYGKITGASFVVHQARLMQFNANFMSYL